MLSHFRLLIATLGLLGFGALPTRAKSPEMPAASFIEFKVLSSYAEDFNQPEEPAPNRVFVADVAETIPERHSTNVAGAVAGLGIVKRMPIP